MFSVFIDILLSPYKQVWYKIKKYTVIIILCTLASKKVLDNDPQLKVEEKKEKRKTFSIHQRIL